jgi:hypothetical protein
MNHHLDDVHTYRMPILLGFTIYGSAQQLHLICVFGYGSVEIMGGVVEARLCAGPLRTMVTSKVGQQPILSRTDCLASYPHVWLPVPNPGHNADHYRQRHWNRQTPVSVA